MNDTCPGCDREYLSAEPWEGKPLKYMSPDELDRWQNEEIRFKSEHPDCHAGAWTFSGSLTKHCSKCCPPAPFNPVRKADPLAMMKAAREKLFGNA